MRSRLFLLVTFVCVLAGAFAGVARALDFDDEDPAPVKAEVGMVISYTIGTHAGCLPHHLVVLGGGFPPGTSLVQINDHTSVLEGIPTDAGTYNVWLAVRDCANKSAETLFTFDIGQRTYHIDTAVLPAAAIGTAYSTKLQASGHPIRSEQWVVSSGALPAGLTLASDGTISGTPTTPGSSTFKVKATSVGDDDHIRVDERDMTISVGGTFSVTLTRRVAEAGVPFSSQLGVAGNTTPFTYSTPSGAPAGLTVSSSGVLSGRPTTVGTHPFTVRIAGPNGFTTDQQVTLVVRPRLAVASSTLRTATGGRAYRAKIVVRGGVGGFTFRVTRGKLPAGLQLAARTGTIAGKPRTSGRVSFTVRVRDSLGATATKSLKITVR